VRLDMKRGPYFWGRVSGFTFNWLHQELQFSRHKLK
jgi:hypothetical protein